MSLFGPLTTRHVFDDGAKMSVLHRYALRLEVSGRSVDIGFEQALEPGVDRLIHEESILVWNGSEGELAVTPAEREAILEKVEEYCKAKRLTYRVIHP
jgi:hypothetical protein